MKYLTTGLICLVIGIVIGGGAFFFYHKKQSQQLENNIVVAVIDGKSGDIQHEKVKNYPDRIEFTTEAKKPGKIKTTIKKEAFCPKVHRNALSAIVYGGMVDLQPVVSYGIEYRRQVLSRVHVLTGVKVDTNVYMVNGFQVFVGAGVNF